MIPIFLKSKKMENKPNFFIVGAAKSGTTALQEMLNEHPNIYMSLIKEPHFFSEDIRKTDFISLNKKIKKAKIEFDAKGNIIPRHQLYINNEEDYLTLFNAADKEKHKILGEASVSYLYSKDAAKNIYSFNPESKIIIILRNPIDRAFSHFLMDLRLGNTNYTNFMDAVKSDFNNKNKGWGISHLYIELGLYHNQIQRYFNVFPKAQIKIYSYEDFKKNNQVIIKDIYKFLDVPFFELDLKNNSNKAEVIKNKYYQKLYSKFRPMLGKFISNEIKSKIKGQIFTAKGLPLLSANEKKLMKHYFLDDINELKKITSIDITSWENK